MVPSTQATYTAYFSVVAARTIKKAKAPAQIHMINAGRVMYARSKNHPAKIIASTDAAEGGMLSSWFLGRPANPRLVVTVGNCQLKPYPPRLRRSCESMKE